MRHAEREEHTFGAHLGRGLSVQDAQAQTGQTAEGVASCKAISGLGERYGVELPITDTVVDVIHNCRSPQHALRTLMGCTARPETPRNLSLSGPGKPRAHVRWASGDFLACCSGYNQPVP
ncbi:NAD(P)H-dependent glycerol-3-phosphate dehydrogenase [Streptomyces sp. NPDC004232]|uniref:NAD(P)H-dependent glycerol-3-phosphate dehydrogenase n=1 Tax=Streptomyces sp. NPDC004232 TaxID=3154454 RepID=UPI001DE2D978|nr:hypothetical protein [Streptomyces sp. tea 10]